MTAIQRWQQMIEVEHAQSDRMRGSVPRPADFWTASAGQFRADPRRTGDRVLDYLLSQVSPDQTVIDVGAGGGRFALPLALHCQRAIAVEPSPSMCQVLRQAAEEFGIRNVSVVESDWLGAEVEEADVALCAHVLYTVSEIESFVRRLEQHARGQVMAVLFQAPPQSQIYPLWEQVHGEVRRPLPSLPEFQEVLAQMGVSPQITTVPTDASRGYDSLEDAQTQLAGRLYLAPGTAPMERLTSLLPEVLEEREGKFRIKGSRPLAPNVVSWRPGD